ncbi:MAG: phosphoribosylanthranilate isomerase [Eubacteriales bacterium]
MKKTKIKICGLTRKCDIDAVNAVFPDYIGFVFTQSRRQISFEQAAILKYYLSDKIQSVGIFKDSPFEMIMQAVNSNIIDIIQLHGIEDEDYIKKLKSITSKPVIKAIRADNAEDILPWNNSISDYLLLDNGKGGTGNMFDWSLAAVCGKEYFLAGGINQTNIEKALDLNPYCIDISSGAETCGLKDNFKIKALTETTHTYANNNLKENT